MSGADGIAFSDAELDTIRRVYTEHCGDGHLALPILRDLLPHRTGDTIRGRARRMKLVRPRYFMPAGKVVASPPMDLEVRQVELVEKPRRCPACGNGCFRAGKR